MKGAELSLASVEKKWENSYINNKIINKYLFKAEKK